MAKRGFVVSDLHLYSDRSRAESFISELDKWVSTCDYLVLNGDSFDFAWTNRPTLAEVIKQALTFIESLLVKYPRCDLCYVIGNHDCEPTFIAGLLELARHYSNLEVYPEYVCLGENLFLHGDVCNYMMDRQGLVLLRKSYTEVRLRSKVAKEIYQYIIKFGLNKVAYISHPKKILIIIFKLTTKLMLKT